MPRNRYEDEDQQPVKARPAIPIIGPQAGTMEAPASQLSKAGFPAAPPPSASDSSAVGWNAPPRPQPFSGAIAAPPRPPGTMEAPASQLRSMSPYGPQKPGWNATQGLPADSPPPIAFSRPSYPPPPSLNVQPASGQEMASATQSLEAGRPASAVAYGNALDAMPRITDSVTRDATRATQGIADRANIVGEGSYANAVQRGVPHEQAGAMFGRPAWPAPRPAVETPAPTVSPETNRRAVTAGALMDLNDASGRGNVDTPSLEGKTPEQRRQIAGGGPRDESGRRSDESPQQYDERLKNIAAMNQLNAGLPVRQAEARQQRSRMRRDAAALMQTGDVAGARAMLQEANQVGMPQRLSPLEAGGAVEHQRQVELAGAQGKSSYALEQSRLATDRERMRQEGMNTRQGAGFEQADKAAQRSAEVNTQMTQLRSRLDRLSAADKLAVQPLNDRITQIDKNKQALIATIGESFTPEEKKKSAREELKKLEDEQEKLVGQANEKLDKIRSEASIPNAPGGTPTGPSAIPPGVQAPGGAGATPNPGDVVDGYRFKGGNPNDKANWEKV